MSAATQRGRWLGLAIVVSLLAVVHAKKGPPTCSGPSPAVEQDDRKGDPSPWDELNGAELAAVRDFLLAQKDLALMPFDEAGPTDNVLFAAELLPPAKDAALRWRRGGAMPERKAYAILFLFTYSKGPRCLQVEVGPLPKPTYWRELVFPRQTPDIHIHSRPISDPEYNGMEEIIVPVMEQLNPMLAKVAGGYTYGDNCGDKCITWSDSSPRGIVRAERKAWIFFMRQVEGNFLHPLGLEMYLDTSGTDASKWYVEKINYADRLWESADDLLAWYESNNRTTPGFAPFTPETAAELQYSTFAPRNKAPRRPVGGRPGPRQFEPAGKRYEIRGSRVFWMGWEFNVGLRSTAGLRFWDIQFNNTRIVYELALQTAVAAYGGNVTASPMQASTYYFDDSWGMGKSHYELVPGQDCPETASYFNIWHLWNAGNPEENKRSICAFEWDMGTPLRRHFQHSNEPYFTSSMRSYAFVVRAISTVYNYDYLWDHIFYMDGTMEVKVMAFGYLQAVRSDPSHGYPLSPDVGGTIHDHVGHWKVDLDVAGTSNSVQMDKIVAEKVATPWHPTIKETWGKKIVRELPEREKDALMTMNPSTPTYYMLINEAAKNKWGTPRGYRIDVLKYSYPLIPDTDYNLQAAQFVKYHVAVTRRKEDEWVSITPFEQATPAEPVLNWASYLEDNERVRNTDLVAWVNSGHWHIPLAEDAPNSPATAASIGFVLRPYNYFDEDAAMYSRDIVTFRPDEDGNQVLEPSTMRNVSRCIPADPKVKLQDYTGASVPYEDDA